MEIWYKENKMAKANIPARRRLSDLYAKGKEVKIDDGNGQVVVWLQKLSPIEQKQAMDKAHAARARIVAVRKANDEDERRMAFLTEAELDGLFNERSLMIEFICGEQIQKLRLSHESELAFSDEWSKNDYLGGLKDAWSDGLNNTFNEDPENVDAQQVYKELQRFYEDVENLVARDKKSILDEYDHTPDDVLQRKVVDMLIESQADQEWVEVFRKTQLFYCVREPDSHSDRYFDSMEELDYLDPRVVSDLSREYDELMVESSEGKDSQEIPAS
jgi:hypothetical protein